MPVKRKVVLQMNSDEEVGSPSSRALTEEAARQSLAVLVLEPGTGLDGKLKTARKGVGDYRSRFAAAPRTPVSIFEKGANAMVEMARQIERIASFTRLSQGITVSPGVIQGGTRSNVVRRRMPCRSRRSRSQRTRPAISGTPVRIATSRSISAVPWKSRAV